METEQKQEKLTEKEKKDKLRKNLFNNIQKYKEKKQKNKELKRKIARENFQKGNKTYKVSNEPIGIAANKDRERRTIIRTKISDIREDGLRGIDLSLLSNKKTNDDIDNAVFLAISTLVSDEMPVVSISNVLPYFLSYSSDRDKMDFRMSIERLVNKGKIFRYGNNISLKSIK